MEDTGSTAKPHRAKTKGRKAEKRKLQENEGAVEKTKGNNPKAFAINNPNKLNRSFRRAQDMKSKKHHIPVVDVTPDLPPPKLVAIIGGPKVGKTTLMKAIIKNYVPKKISDIKGPVTFSTSKKSRMTLFECNTELPSMMDIAKVADQVLVLINANQLDMHVLECLNMFQVAGMPKVMGVLTHVDTLPQKAIKKQKKKIKHRFGVEICKGAKLFYLDRLIYGEYGKKEIKNLCKFFHNKKQRPIDWKNNHPYVVADRMEDITDPEQVRLDESIDRTVAVYGYMRGQNMLPSQKIHIPGVGDFDIDDLSFKDDPCPLASNTAKKRRILDMRDRNVHAPMSGVGGIVYENDSVYINVNDGGAGAENQRKRANIEDEEEEKMMMKDIMTSKGAGDAGSEDVGIRMFKHSKVIKGGGEAKRMKLDSEAEEDESGDDSGSEAEESEDESEDSEDESDAEESEDESEAEESEDESENEDSEEEEGIDKLNWKTNIAQEAKLAFFERQTKDLSHLVYNDNDDKKSDDVDNNDDDELFTVSDTAFDAKRDVNRYYDVCKNYHEQKFNSVKYEHLCDWSVEEEKLKMMDHFVTGEWKADEDAKTLLDQDDALFGDFKDLEDDKEGDSGCGDEDEEKSDAESSDEDEPYRRVEKETKKEREARAKEKRMEKKLKQKALFDRNYDLNKDGKLVSTGETSLFDEQKSVFAEQARVNREEFSHLDEKQRCEIEGFRAGLYVRVEISKVPADFVRNFSPHHLLILGGLLPDETSFGYVTARVLRHKFYKRNMKSGDPITMSIGWRRFQTRPMYFKMEHNMRQRYLKYTPEFQHCHCVFYGAFAPPKTGIVAVQTVGDDKDYRIAMTGDVVEIDASVNLKKKIKLTGDPYKIDKNTAFIKGMFTSSLEVAKLENSAIRTVSGIRGTIKKAVRSDSDKIGGPDGSFRATFEDKIKMSDIVFLKAWANVPVPQYHAYVTNLLLKQKDSWVGEKTIGRIRFENKMKAPVNLDSLYKVIKRPVIKREGLVLNPKLQKELPFSSKPKFQRKKMVTKAQKTLKPVKKSVMRNKDEHEMNKLITQLNIIVKNKKAEQRAADKKRYQYWKEEQDKKELEALRRDKQKVRAYHKSISKKEGGKR